MSWQRQAVRVARFLVGLTAAAALGGCAHTTLNDLIHGKPSPTTEEQSVHERMAGLKARIAHLQSQLQEVQTADSTRKPAQPSPSAVSPPPKPAPAGGAHPWQLVTSSGEEGGGRLLYSYVLFSAGSHPLSAVDSQTRDSLAAFLDEVRALPAPAARDRGPLFVVPADLAGPDEQPALTTYNAALAATLLGRAMSGTQTGSRPAGIFLLVTPAPLGQEGAEAPRLLIDCTSLPDDFRQNLLRTVAAPVAPGSAAARLSALAWALAETTGSATPTLTLRRSGALVIADWLR